MNTTFQVRVGTVLFFGFLLMLALWIAGFVLVVGSRMLHDRRARRLTKAERALADPGVAALPPLERSSVVPSMLSRMSRRGVYRLVSRTDLSTALSEACFAWCMKFIGLEQMARDASARQGRSKWQRVSAILALGRVRDERVYGVLDAAVRDPDSDVAAAAAATLHRIGDRRAAGILVSALRSASLAPSRVATHLEQYPISIDDLLMPLLDDEQPRVRYWAASLLMRYPNVEGIASRMSTVAKDADPQVRKAALASLGFMARDAAVAAARENLEYPVPFVRATAIRVLARHGSLDRDRAKRREIGAMIAPSLAHESWNVRAAAKESLVRLGPVTWHEVAAQLDSPDELARREAAEVLQNLGVIDWTIESMAAGATPDSEILGVLRRAFSVGGSALADAARLRSEPEASHVFGTLLSNVETVRGRP